MLRVKKARIIDIPSKLLEYNIMVEIKRQRIKFKSSFAHGSFLENFAIIKLKKNSTMGSIVSHFHIEVGVRVALGAMMPHHAR